MSKFCGYCGTELDEYATTCTNCGKPTGVKHKGGQHAAPSRAKGITFSGSHSLVLVSVVLALVNVILPFLKWIKIPILNSFGSMFGMAEDIASYSLFTYITASNSMGSDPSILLIVVAVIAFLGVIFNALYIIQSLFGKSNSTKCGTLGASISLVMSILFLLFAGFSQLVLKVIVMTPMVAVSIVTAILEVKVIKKIKNESL